MESDARTKEIVREKYASIAAGKRLPVSASCCGGSGVSSLTEEGYAAMEGYSKDADLSLGCGLPTALASLSRVRRSWTSGVAPATTRSSRPGPSASPAG